MPNFQLIQVNVTQNAVSIADDAISMVTDVLSTFTTSPTREQIFKKEREENEWRINTNSVLSQLEQTYLDQPNSQNAKAYLNKLSELQKHFVTKKYKDGEHHIDSVEYREAVENLKRLQDVLNEFTYLFLQHKFEELKSSSTKSKSSDQQEDWQSFFDMQDTGQYKLTDPRLVRLLAAKQAEHDGDKLIAQELTQSLENTKQYVTKKFNEQKAKQKPVFFEKFKNKMFETREQFDKAFTSKIDPRYHPKDDHDLKNCLDSNFQMGQSIFVRNYLGFILDHYDFTIRFSPESADIIHDKEKKLLILPMDFAEYDTDYMAVVYRYMFNHVVHKILDKTSADLFPPYYPNTESEREKYLDLMNEGDLRIQKFYKIHLKKLNKEQCTIAENQEYARYVGALKHFKIAATVYDDNLSKEHSDSLKKIKAKVGDIITLSDGDKIKLLKCDATYKTISYEYVGDNVREFYTLYLDNVVTSRKSTRRGVQGKSSFDYKKKAVTNFLQNYFDEMQSKTYSAEEQNKYVENRDSALCTVASQYSSKFIETFYPEIFLYQKQLIDKALSVINKKEPVDISEQEQMCHRAGRCRTL